MSKENDLNLFEIQDSSINVQEIIEELESTIRKMDVDSEEISRISNLKPKELNERNSRFFDPAYTATLFEKGISPPKFTNPSLWFIKGPLRWIIVKFIEFYSLFDKKVSENRIKAFYSVIYELVDLKKKYESLYEKLEEIQKDILILKQNHTSFQKSRPSSISLVSTDVNKKFNDKIINKFTKTDFILILYPDDENLLKELEFSNIPFLALTEDKEQYTYLKLNITKNVELLDSILNYQSYKDFNHIVFASNLCLFSGWLIQKIIYNIWEFSSSKTTVYLKYTNSALTNYSPFQEVYRTKIVPELLIYKLRELGFKNVVHHTSLEDEYSLITFQKV